MKSPRDIRALSLITFCLLATFLLSSLSTAAEAPQRITDQVIQLDTNTADAAANAAALTGIRLARAIDIAAYSEIFGTSRALQEVIEVPGSGAATIEKNSGRILLTDDCM